MTRMPRSVLQLCSPIRRGIIRVLTAMVWRMGCQYIEFNGKRQTIAQWARDVGVSKETMWRRLRRSNMSLKDALTLPPMETKAPVVTGVTWFDQYGMWRARIMVKGKRFFLGNYRDWFDAVCARKRAEYEFGAKA